MDWSGIPRAMDLSKSLLSEWDRYKVEMGSFLEEPERKRYPDCRKVAIFMYCIGDEGIRIFNSFSFEKQEDKDNYNVVVGKFEAYFNPNESVCYESNDDSHSFHSSYSDSSDISAVESVRSKSNGNSHSLYSDSNPISAQSLSHISQPSSDHVHSKSKSRHLHTGEKPHGTHTGIKLHVTHTGEKPRGSECVVKCPKSESVHTGLKPRASDKHQMHKSKQFKLPRINPALSEYMYNQGGHEDVIVLGEDQPESHGTVVSLHTGEKSHVQPDFSATKALSHTGKKPGSDLLGTTALPHTEEPESYETVIFLHTGEKPRVQTESISHVTTFPCIQITSPGTIVSSHTGEKLRVTESHLVTFPCIRIPSPRTIVPLHLKEKPHVHTETQNNRVYDPGGTKITSPCPVPCE